MSPAAESTLPPPKGVLLLGVQGAGKSLAAKCVAGAWQLPLFRMDFGALYQKYHGETERNIREALAVANAMAPCVLWMDEIEQGVAGDAAGDADGGVSRRVLGTLLTWMNERTARVFLVATANDISQLPPELLRKGRFDEIFFVDLPGAAAREDILRIHLRRNKQDPAAVDLARLGAASEGFSGAEIEQAIVAALYEAHAEKKGLSNEAIEHELRRTPHGAGGLMERENRMLSWEIVEHGKPLQKVVRDTPKPLGSEVLMRVTRSGVCHSDLHIWDGYFDLGGGKRFYVKDRGCVPPFTPGHEPFGVVEALGPRAKGVRIGQKRLIYPWIGCGKCAVCKAGQDNYCVSGTRFLGVNRAGAYATHVLVPDPKYLVDTAGIDDSFAATLACSAVTAYSAAAKLPALNTKDSVAVLGCGGLGLIGISILRAQGVKNIIGCDIDDAKLAAAAKQGAKKTVNTRAPDALSQLQGAAAALDFVGSPATAALGIGALRKGGRYVICGLYGGELVHPLPPIAQRAIGIIGSYVGSLQELKEVVALAKKGKIKPMPVETRPADEANRALEDLKAGKVVGRVVLDFETVAA